MSYEEDTGGEGEAVRRKAVSVKRTRGRPQFKPTPKLKTQVERRIAVGWTQIDIAAEIGIDVKTLNVHFADQLTHGLARKRGEALDLLWRSARGGNVSAQRTLAAMQTPTPGEKSELVADKIERAVRLGKKEIAQQEAETAGAGTDWGDDLVPGKGLN